MALVIREMCFDDRQEVQALLRAAGDDGAAEQGSPQSAEQILQKRSTLSLVACEEGKIVAAVVCDGEGQCGYLHHLPETQLPRGDITKALVDKTMLKLNARGVGKCRIDLPQGDTDYPLWDEVKWGNADDCDSADTATPPPGTALPDAEPADTAPDDAALPDAEPALETMGPVTEPG